MCVWGVRVCEEGRVVFHKISKFTFFMTADSFFPVS